MVSGCSDGLHERGLLEPSYSTVSSASQESAYWVDDVLEFTNAGVSYRWERYGPSGAPTSVMIYANGVHEVTLHPEYAGGTMAGWRLTEAMGGEWVINDAYGNVLSTSEPGECEPGGGPQDPPDPGGPPVEPTEPTDPCDGEPDLLTSTSDCGLEYNEMQDAAWEAAAVTGTAALLTATPLYPVGIVLAGVAADRTVTAGRKLFSWAVCKWNNHLHFTNDEQHFSELTALSVQAGICRTA
jgi:hypothetical protein